MREELAAIRSLMAESQTFLCGTWPHQLVWGFIGTTGVAVTWLVLGNEGYGWIPWIWGVLILAGWSFSLSRMRVETTRAPVRNVASRAFGGIWLALGLTLTLMGAVTLLSQALDPHAIPGLIAIVFGAGYFASGFLAGLRWLIGVAALWWIGGVGLLVWSSTDALLALATMTLVLEVAPALVLRRMEQSPSVG